MTERVSAPPPASDPELVPSPAARLARYQRLAASHARARKKQSREVGQQRAQYHFEGKAVRKA